MITLKFEDDVTLEEVEEAVIMHVLSKNKYNQTLAAKKLGLSLRAMNNKVDRYRKEGCKIPSYSYLKDKYSATSSSSRAGK